MTVTTDTQRVATLVMSHGIDELAQSIYEWLSSNDADTLVSDITQHDIMNAIRYYGDIAP